MKIQALVLVAGGRGERMGTKTPKQFLVVNRKPVLMHSLERFHVAMPEAQKVVVLPADQIDFWNQLCEDYQFVVPHEVCEGGKERFHSVQNGLKLLKDCDYVGIHDGVRPLIPIALILKAFAEVSQEIGVVPGIPMVDTVRFLTKTGSKALKRQDLTAIQTPQVFHLESLKKAYDLGYKEGFTDDASVWEAAGKQIKIIEGDVNNIKISNPKDLVLVEHLFDIRY